VHNMFNFHVCMFMLTNRGRRKKVAVETNVFVLSLGCGLQV
jgi:hypothetical protein